MKKHASNKHSVELVIASTNMHKVREFRSLLKAFPQIDLLSLADFPDYKPLEETGKSFEEIAIVKATHAAKALHRWVLAEDSGLVVPSLKGAPGIYSARYAGKNATDLDNRKKLLAEMTHLLDEDRNAFYECCIVIASPEGQLKKTARGTCEGMILLQDKGSCGFGYDSLFMKHGYNKSFAELGEQVKNQVSHRRKAIDKLLSSIEALCSS